MGGINKHLQEKGLFHIRTHSECTFCEDTETVYDNVVSPSPEGKYIPTQKTGGRKLEREGPRETETVDGGER